MADADLCKEEGWASKLTVVLPQAEIYEEELFRYENMPSDAPSVSLEEAIEKSQKRLMVVKKIQMGS